MSCLRSLHLHPPPSPYHHHHHRKSSLVSDFLPSSGVSAELKLLSVLKFCAQNGIYVGWSLSRNKTNSDLPDNKVYSTKIEGWGSCCSFDKKGNNLRLNDKWQNRNKLLKQIIVRSEVTGTGSPEAAFQLSDVELESKIRGFCFYAVTSLTAIFLFVGMLIAHPFVLIFDRYRRKAHHLIAKLWALLTISPFVKVDFLGLENLPSADTPAVYVSNHQSFLDTYTLLTLGRSFKFISKTAIFLFPVIGWAMFMMGLIPLKRMDSRSQLQTLKRCMDLVKKGGSVFFFPEGTRSKDGKLGVFKKGAFSIAAKTKVPVVPISLIGTGKIMPVGKESRLYRGSVKVVIHPPLKGDNADSLCAETRTIIANTLTHQT
jgi:1-acyl-sn-glycerol-3-phosphate acyltransferase